MTADDRAELDQLLAQACADFAAQLAGLSHQAAVRHIGKLHRHILANPPVAGRDRRALRIHVNRHIIAANQKTGERSPPITIIRGSAREYGSAVQLLGEARIVYSPDKPLACGARLWIEATDARVQ